MSSAAPGAFQKAPLAPRPRQRLVAMDELKAKGNAAFSAGRYAEAIEHFGAAIDLAPSNHVLYSNRSAAKAALRDFEGALGDAKKVTELEPSWAKGYSRLGAALFGLAKYDDSIAAYKQGLDIDPTNAQLAQGLSEVEAAKRSAAAGPAQSGLGALFSSPDVWAKIAQNPETRAYLQQPDFVSILQGIQADPTKLNQHMGDPRVMSVMGLLLGVPMQAGAAPTGSGPAPPPEPATEAPKPAPPKPKEPEPEPAPMEISEAMKAKELGNAAYKKKDFAEAIAQYNRAIDLDPNDVSFLNNRAAVYLEQGEYDLCIKDCDDALEKGRELRADYKVIARALQRKGNAYVKKGMLEEAIEMYQKSLTEHRDAGTLKRLNETEKTLKTKKEQEYLDPVKGEEHRQKGNDFFREGKYPDAVQEYTESLKRNPTDHRVYSNRAACYTKLTAFMEAQKDADKCIELEPTFTKGYSRKATVQFFMKEYDKAMETYQLGLKYDPSNEELRDGVARCVDMINKGNRGEMSEEDMKQRQERAMSDPEIQAILQDPIMRQVLQDFQENPKAAQQHAKQPDIMAKIQKLVNAGIVRMG